MQSLHMDHARLMGTYRILWKHHDNCQYKLVTDCLNDCSIDCKFNVECSLNHQVPQQCSCNINDGSEPLKDLFYVSEKHGGVGPLSVVFSPDKASLCVYPCDLQQSKESALNSNRGKLSKNKFIIYR